MRPSRGIALVTVLLIVAIASLAATALLSSSSLAIHRTASLRDTEQAWWLAWSGQSFGLAVLAEDAKPPNGDVDGLHEAWAMPVQFPVDQGGIRGQIVDQQGRINLNNLVSVNQQVQFQTVTQAQLLRLMTVLNIDTGPEIVAALRDWMDADDTPIAPGSAESNVYLGLDPPYRAANRPMSAASELLAVQGVTPKIYQALRPYVTALPKDTLVNVNTAPVQVLLALCDVPDVKAIEAFDQGRRQDVTGSGAGPVRSAQDYINRGYCDASLRAEHIAVKTEHFRIEGDAFIGSSRVALYSLIQRSGTTPPSVLSFSTDGD